MKKIILILAIIVGSALTISCSEKDEETLSEWKCGTYNGNQLWTGPRGGCYYYNTNSNRTYVDRCECNC